MLKTHLPELICNWLNLAMAINGWNVGGEISPRADWERLTLYAAILVRLTESLPRADHSNTVWSGEMISLFVKCCLLVIRWQPWGRKWLLIWPEGGCCYPEIAARCLLLGLWSEGDWVVMVRIGGWWAHGGRAAVSVWYMGVIIGLRFSLEKFYSCSVHIFNGKDRLIHSLSKVICYVYFRATQYFFLTSSTLL